MSEVLIDKYLLDKYLAPFNIDSEGTQLSISMLSATNPSFPSPHAYPQPSLHFQPCCPPILNAQADIITTYRPTPCHLPTTSVHIVTPSRCLPELFHSSPVSQMSSGPWSTIDRYGPGWIMLYYQEVVQTLSGLDSF